MSFWQKVFTSGTYSVQVMDVAVGTWNTLVSYGWTSDVFSYTLQQFDLSAYAGKTIRVQFADYETSSGTSYAWAIDDLCIGKWSDCQINPGPTVGTFNAFESATPASSTTGNIQTKVAGTGFNLDLVAISPTPPSAVLSTFNGSVKVEVLANLNVSAVDASNCPTAFGTTTLFTGTATITGGRSTYAITGLSNAWRDARIRITYPASGTASVVICSTDNFAIRPGSLAMAATDADWATAGGTRALNSASASSATFHKAGLPFTLGGAAYDALSNVTGNYNGGPNMVVTACAGTACVGTPGSLQLAGVPILNLTFASGVASSNLSYSEAGSFNVQLMDTNFANVDAADTPGDCSPTGRYVCSTVTPMGRFVPDHFVISPGIDVHGCTGFTYFGQDFATAFTVTAQNFANITAQNYTGAVAKLGLNAWGNFGFSADSGVGLTAGLILQPSGPTGTWSNGQASVVAAHNPTRPASPLAPLNINVYANPTDSDGVTVATPTVINTGLEPLRYGRLQLQNAYGSELLALPVPLQAQYWTGSYYATNTADACTAIAMSSIQMGNYHTNLVACNTVISPTGTVTLVAGKLPGAGLVLSKPGAGHSGSVDLDLNLGATATGNTCVSGSQSGASAANLPWFGTDPTARATFGIYKSPLIYRRENY